MQRSGGMPVFVVVVLVVVIFGGAVYLNSRPTGEMRVIIPEQVEPTQAEVSWQSILSEGFGNDRYEHSLKPFGGGFHDSDNS